MRRDGSDECAHATGTSCGMISPLSPRKNKDLYPKNNNTHLLCTQVLSHFFTPLSDRRRVRGLRSRRRPRTRRLDKGGRRVQSRWSPASEEEEFGTQTKSTRKKSSPWSCASCARTTAPSCRSINRARAGCPCTRRACAPSSRAITHALGTVRCVQGTVRRGAGDQGGGGAV